MLSTSIRKYMYLALHRCFRKNEITLKYSKTETVCDVSQIEHRIFRQCLSDFDVSGVEITSMADVPAGTGLGSSSSFTVALLELLHAYRGEYVSSYQLAKEACEVEIERLGEPIGKQDQFAAAFGGLRFYEFHPSGYVGVEPIIMRPESYQRLESNLMMFHLGGIHSASETLREQGLSVAQKDKEEAQLRMCDYARELKEALQDNDVDAMGPLLHENWLLKRTLASGISNPVIDDAYARALGAGATGGKLLGAGGAGFMLFYVPAVAQQGVRAALADLEEFDFEMDNSGCRVVFIDKDFA